MYYIKTRTFDSKGNMTEEGRTAATFRTVRQAMGELRMWGFEPFHEVMDGFKKSKLPHCWRKDDWYGQGTNAYIMKEEQ